VGADCGDEGKGSSGQFDRLVNCDWMVVLRVVLGTSRVQVVAWEGRGRTTHSALGVKEVGENSRVDWLCERCVTSVDAGMPSSRQFCLEPLAYP
jgi:hypothetical protein